MVVSDMRRRLTAATIAVLASRGLSQAAIGAMYGLCQSRVSQILKHGGLGTSRTRAYVNRGQRDGNTNPEPTSAIWQPYRILHPSVAKMFFETRASELQYIPTMEHPHE